MTREGTVSEGTYEWGGCVSEDQKGGGYLQIVKTKTAVAGIDVADARRTWTVQQSVRVWEAVWGVCQKGIQEWVTVLVR